MKKYNIPDLEPLTKYEIKRKGTDKFFKIDDPQNYIGKPSAKYEQLFNIWSSKSFPFAFTRSKLTLVICF